MRSRYRKRGKTRVVHKYVRDHEFVLCISGGLSGFSLAIVYLIASTPFIHFLTELSLGLSALLASIVSLKAVNMVDYRTKSAGLIMILCSIWGLISIHLFYVLPALLLLIGGIMCLVKKDRTIRLIE
jgi:hypothetical protein